MKILVLTVTILSLALTITQSQSIEVYIPTITSACTYRSNGIYRLNVQWKFLDDTTNLSEIDGFIIIAYYLNSTRVIQVFHYPDDSNTDVTVAGKTSVSNIPLPNVTNTLNEVRVTTVTNRAVNPPSEYFAITECNMGELNLTNTTATKSFTDITVVVLTTSTSIQPFISSTALPTSSDLTNLSDDFSSRGTVVSNIPTSNNNDDSDSIAAIIGAVVGTLLLTIVIIIIMMVMIMILCRRRKKDIDNKNVMIHELSPNPQQCTHNTPGANIDPTTRLDTVNALYLPTEVKSIDALLQHIHGRSRSGSNVIITPNPSYTVDPNSLQSRKESEYQYDYVQPDDGLPQHDRVVPSTGAGEVHGKVTDHLADNNVFIDPNPSYSLPQVIKLEDNPSYEKLQL